MSSQTSFGAQSFPIGAGNNNGTCILFVLKHTKKKWPLKLKLPFFGRRRGRLAKPGNSNIISQPVHHYLCKELSLALNSRSAELKLSALKKISRYSKLPFSLSVFLKSHIRNK